MGGNVQSTPVRYLPGNRFRVSVDGESYGEFKTGEGFDDVEIGKMEIRTGESNVVASQSAGNVTYSVAKFTQGAVPSGNNKMRKWVALIVGVGGQNGDVDPQYKKIVTVTQLDRDGTPVDTWTLNEAWPTKYSGGKFDADSNAYRMVEVEITYRWNDGTAAQV